MNWNAAFFTITTLLIDLNRRLGGRLSGSRHSALLVLSRSLRSRRNVGSRSRALRYRYGGLGVGGGGIRRLRHRRSRLRSRGLLLRPLAGLVGISRHTGGRCAAARGNMTTGSAGGFHWRRRLDGCRAQAVIYVIPIQSC
jgi:hypothetical protein